MEKLMVDIAALLEHSSRSHSHLCPRQVLGVRIGLAGAAALGLEPNTTGKRLLAILETDGCFADGVRVATGCTVGHRTLRVEDYGKTAATFADTQTGKAVRVTTRPNVRTRAALYAPGETKQYYAQLTGYQVMPDEELMEICPVTLDPPVEVLVSQHGLREECARCGEEIINARQVVRDGVILCRWCAGDGYYKLASA